VVEGSVSGVPCATEGGHVFFKLRDGSGEVDCAAYEPSKEFRKTVSRLAVGDALEAAGGVREADEGITLNLEYLRVTAVAEVTEMLNPRCPKCGGSTESMGRGQGFRCRRCGEKLRGAVKMKKKVERSLALGLYVPPPRAERHLTKPPARIGREKPYTHAPLHEPWHGEAV